MGYLVPRRPYFPHSLALCCHYPVSKCRSASIVVTSTLRVKDLLDNCMQVDWLTCVTPRIKQCNGAQFWLFFTAKLKTILIVIDVHNMLYQTSLVAFESYAPDDIS